MMILTGDTGLNSWSIASFVKTITFDERVGDDNENGLFGSTGASLQIQQSYSSFFRSLLEVSKEIHCVCM